MYNNTPIEGIQLKSIHDTKNGASMMRTLIARGRRRLRLGRIFRHVSSEQAFTKIYQRNLWKNSESVSGIGSTLTASEPLRLSLPALLRRFEVATLLDAGCGDFNWMKTVELHDIAYTGIDVVRELISRNSREYASPSRSFIFGDISETSFTRFDMILCRHCFIHLPNLFITKTLANFKRSGSRFLLTTTCPQIATSVDIYPGGFRLINLQLPPFDLPRPILLLEDCLESSGKLGLWPLSDIP